MNSRDDDEKGRTAALQAAFQRQVEIGQAGKKDNKEVVDRVNSAEGFLHKMLGLKEDASFDDFKGKINSLKLQVHPDQNNNTDDSTRAFTVLNETYKEYSDYVNAADGRSYKDFLLHKGMKISDDDNDTVFDYASVDTRPHAEIFREQYYQSYEAPTPPSLQQIMSKIREWAESYGGQFQFGSLMTFTKIQVEDKDGTKEVKVSATCKKVYEMAQAAIKTHADVNDTLRSMLDVLAKSKQSEASPARTQKVLGFFHLKKRSKNTKAIHQDLQKEIQKMLDYKEPKHSRSRGR